MQSERDPTRVAVNFLWKISSPLHVNEISLGIFYLTCDEI